MEQLQISVISKKPKKIDGLLSYIGEIKIGNYKETFVMPLNSWTIEEYQQQWKDGLERIKTHNKSCLVTVVQNLNANPLIEFWSLHKKNNQIILHNHMLVREIAKELNLPISLSDFNSKNCYEFVLDRVENQYGHAIDDEQRELSEWRINLKDI